MSLVQKELLRIGGLLLVGLVGGLISGAYGWSLLVALTCWVLWQVMEFTRLSRWSKRPLSRPNNISPLWRSAAERAHQSVQVGRQRTRSVLAQIRRLQIATEALPDGAVLMTPGGAIETFNSSARRLLGLSTEDQGENLGLLIRHPDLATLINGEIDDDLVEIASPTDDDRRLEIRRIAVDDDRMLILARDVTQLNRLLTMRQDFIANVSHELRTPLTVIMGYLEAAEDTSLDPAMLRELLGKLVSPSQRMRALVDDLLLLTRLESSPALDPVQIGEVDVPSLVRRIVADASQLSDDRHRFNADVDAALRLRGVESELHSAFGNLVANAVRYSPEGGDIKVRWFHTDAGARFEVEDQGVGIQPEHLSRITERFYRIDLAGSRVRGGTGLGLSIVKHVLKRHDSGLEVRSEFGQGSRFYCVFPPQFSIPVNRG